MCIYICDKYIYICILILSKYIYLYIRIFIFISELLLHLKPTSTSSPSMPDFPISSCNSVTKTPSPSTCADKPEISQEVGDQLLTRPERTGEFQWTSLKHDKTYLFNQHSLMKWYFSSFYDCDLLLYWLVTLHHRQECPSFAEFTLHRKKEILPKVGKYPKSMHIPLPNHDNSQNCPLKWQYRLRLVLQFAAKETRAVPPNCKEVRVS